MNNQQIEEEITEKGKTTPRVMPQYIESIILGEHFSTTYDGVRVANMGVGGSWTAHKSVDLLTFCVLVLRNGFTITGGGACMSPKNFDAEIGREITRQSTVNKTWMFGGYLLKQELSEQQLLQKPFPAE